MGSFWEKANQFGNKFSGLLVLLQFLSPAIVGVLFYFSTQYLDNNYLRKSDFDHYAETQKAQFDHYADTQKIQFDTLGAKLNTLIEGQISFDGKLQLVNTLLQTQQSQLNSNSDRILYLERQKRQ